ncbi:MAG: hypothetical protein MUC88_28815 [Planctomycetes bacterium]|nr:hypothetical protein [Planctomycetota bacterium]
MFSSTKEKAIRSAHEMKNDETGEVVARTVLVAVHIDKATRKCWSDLCWLWEATHGQARVETIIGGAERVTIRRVGIPLLAITTVGKRADEILTGKFTGINHHAITGATTGGLS